jgi:hypothetical protein
MCLCYYNNNIIMIKYLTLNTLCIFKYFNFSKRYNADILIDEFLTKIKLFVKL